MPKWDAWSQQPACSLGAAGTWLCRSSSQLELSLNNQDTNGVPTQPHHARIVRLLTKYADSHTMQQ